MKRIRSFQSVPGNSHDIYIEEKYHFDDKTTDPRSVFTKLSDIGKGSFGIVSQILYLPEMHLFAGKFLNPAIINESTKQIFQNGVEKACKIQSESINQYYGCITFEESLIILMDFCEHGSLRDILNERQKAFSEDQISIILYDLLTGIDQIHKDYQIIHKNIKSSNLLLNSNSKIKITDLFLSNPFEFFDSQNTDSLSCQMVGIVGTPYWMAPEIITKSEFSYASDIWSVGITAIELSEGAPPFIEFTPSKAMLKIVKNGFPGYRFPEKHSDEFKDFVSHCLEFNPSLRWNSEKLLEHPFIQRAKKLNREKVLEELIKVEIGHLKVNSNLLKKNKNKVSNSLLMNDNQMFYNSVVASSIAPHSNDKKSDNDNENNSASNYKNYFNFSSIKNFYPFNTASFKSVSNLKLSPRLQSLIRSKQDTDSVENKNEKYFDFIDHSIDMDKNEKDDILNFISKAHEMSSQLNSVPFEIASNQNAEIQSIYASENKNRNLMTIDKVDSKPKMFQRLPLKIVIIVSLFFATYNFDFRTTLLLSILLITYCLLNYFVFSKK